MIIKFLSLPSLPHFLRKKRYTLYTLGPKRLRLFTDSKVLEGFALGQKLPFQKQPMNKLNPATTTTTTPTATAATTTTVTNNENMIKLIFNNNSQEFFAG